MASTETAAIVVQARAAVQRSQRLMSEMQALQRQVSAETASLREAAHALVLTMSRTTARVTESHEEPPVRRPDPEDAERLRLLTPRELEVLRLIGEGQRTKEIAFSLGITFKTAVTHRSNIMEKLGIHEGPRLVRFAIRAGVCGV